LAAGVRSAGLNRAVQIKGPGNRLQDNQKRWPVWFNSRQLPDQVCHVLWEPAADGPS